MDLVEKIKEAKEVYKKDGVANIPQVFSKQEVDCIRAAALMSLCKIGEPSGYKHNQLEIRNNFGQDFPLLMYWPCLKNKYLNKIRQDERMIIIAREFLGDNVK